MLTAICRKAQLRPFLFVLQAHADFKSRSEKNYLRNVIDDLLLLVYCFLECLFRARDVVVHVRHLVQLVDLVHQVFEPCMQRHKKGIISFCPQSDKIKRTSKTHNTLGVSSQFFFPLPSSSFHILVKKYQKCPTAIPNKSPITAFHELANAHESRTKA